jgi:hypothetical protein
MESMKRPYILEDMARHFNNSGVCCDLEVSDFDQIMAYIENLEKWKECAIEEHSSLVDLTI